MRGIQTDTRILIAVVAMMALLVVLTILVGPGETAPSLSVRSAAPDGAMALQMWIERSGYQTQELTDWDQLNRMDVLFVLDPLAGYSSEDTLLIQNWVRRGHTLIVAGYPLEVNHLLEPFGLSLDNLFDSPKTALPSGPTLRTPPFGAVNVEAIARVQITDPAKQPLVTYHLYAGDVPVLASQSLARGRVWASGTLRPFTNRGLRDPGSAGLVANLLAGTPRTAVIGFDEIAHGFSSASERSLFAWLVTTPPGWGVLLGFGLTLTYLALRGRRFGRALPLPDERLRRESAEYIHAMATLFRRSGQRREILKHHEQRLRRELSARYGVDPRLESVELVRAVVYHDPGVDEAALRHLLGMLANRSVSEQELVQTVSELDHFLRTTT